MMMMKMMMMIVMMMRMMMTMMRFRTMAVGSAGEDESPCTPAMQAFILYIIN